MFIMQYGYGLQNSLWHVREERPPHYLRIYWMDGGSVTYRDENETRKLDVGKLYVFPAQKPYEMTQNPEDPISCTYLHADVFPCLLHRLAELNPEEDEDLLMTLMLLRRQMEYGGERTELVKSFSAALLQLLMRASVFEEEAAPAALLKDMDVHTATVQSMSQKAGYTPEYYIRSFSRSVGVTPYQYLLSQKMNEAVSLMSEGMMLEEIAQHLGYASGKSFSGAFKRRFGIPPDEYRKYFLKKA